MTVDHDVSTDVTALAMYKANMFELAGAKAEGRALFNSDSFKTLLQFFLMRKTAR
jgi:hypothetical protein